MSRRKAATKREILPDSKYGNLVVAKCINVVMWDGKKEVAENIVYGALDKLKKIAKDGDELAAFLEAVDALKPSVEVRVAVLVVRLIRFLLKFVLRVSRLWLCVG